MSQTRTSLLTLRQTLALGMVLLCVCLASVLNLVYQFAVTTAESQVRRVLEEVAEGVRTRVRGFLVQPADVADSFQLQVQNGVLDLSESRQVVFALVRAALERPELLEISFTYEKADAPTVQVTVSREAGGQHLLVNQVRPEGDIYRRHSRKLKLNAPPQRELPKPGPEVDNPRLHPTYTTPAERDRAFWSDLHWSQLDGELPEDQRRVELSLQKPIHSSSGELAGVLRVGFVTARLSQLMASAPEGHWLFLGDTRGRLISHAKVEGPPAEDDYDLRYPVNNELLRSVLSRGKALNEENRQLLFGRIEVAGAPHFYTLTTIDEPDDPRLDTWEWTMGVVAPGSLYLSELRRRSAEVLLAVALLGLVLLGGSAFLVHFLRQDLEEIGRRAQRMGEFDFEAEEPRARFRDIVPILERFEAAKTVVRSMGRYLPVPLVRDLYRSNREPQLGGELRDVTLMFTDIASFTEVAESMSADELAHMLGLYFEAVAEPIQHRNGVIDKYIGDAVMCFWNAPSPLAEHSVAACHAALEALAKADALFASDVWGGRAPLRTRIGLHRDRVLVGHFGSPDRMDFTALGDGVNLASRMEGINRFYGTQILVSESVWHEAKEVFEFRRLDKLAAKGKTEGIWVFELLGLKGQVDRGPYDLYERALEFYHREQFQQALELLEDLEGRAAKLLRQRCQEYLQHPPPEDWDGITRWSEK